MLLVMAIVLLLLVVALNISRCSRRDLDGVRNRYRAGARGRRRVVENPVLWLVCKRIKLDTLGLHALDSVRRGCTADGMRALAASRHDQTRGILAERRHVGKVEEDVMGRGMCGPGRGGVGVCSGEGRVDGADVVDRSGHGLEENTDELAVLCINRQHPDPISDPISARERHAVTSCLRIAWARRSPRSDA
jgi:hypothetical protein